MENYIYVLITHEGVVLRYSEHRGPLIYWAEDLDLKNYKIVKIYKIE